MAFVAQNPIMVTLALVTCTLLALAIVGLLEAAGFEFWDE